MVSMKSAEEIADEILQLHWVGECSGARRNYLVGELKRTQRDALEEAVKRVQICHCEITLDYDGLEHILDEIRMQINALAEGLK